MKISTILSASFPRGPILLNEKSERPKPLEEIIYPAYCVPESVHTDVLFREMQRQKDSILPSWSMNTAG